MNAYFTKLENRANKVGSNLCIGLDPDPAKLPPKMGAGAEGVFKFCTEIIGATHEYAAAYKPNLAFFEAVGTDGWHLLAQVIQEIPKDIPVIVDAKRGDIGSTAEAYARSLFDVLNADAVTLNPFLGEDSLRPFLDRKERGLYILCLTSNPGASDFQLWFDLYMQIARKVSEWNDAGNCGMVVGATQPARLSNVIAEAPGIPLLVPGVGAQGGEIDVIAPIIRNGTRAGAVVNVSRAILYASQKADFARAARKAAMEWRDRLELAIGGAKMTSRH